MSYIDAMEIKDAWIELAPDGIKAGKEKQYYLSEFNGLAVLHILTKDVPNWFWCTFHHVDNPITAFGYGDSAGQPTERKGTIWENYRSAGSLTQNYKSI